MVISSGVVALTNEQKEDAMKTAQSIIALARMR
jgi:hypothetical protein